ncbi:hypothetical protein L596_022535 [Steinernema carpocapsae]|uniref:Cell cycle control protein 50A n=1 Tax=Steinernema carpocapsae TaxID=34508 RepID=A0A4U5MMU5_STECR|nr:hypothetical protein L596_022535 [Steinernema carpocapsae]
MEKKKKNRPKDSLLRQQRLPAWQPILSARTIISMMFLVGIAFIPIGVVLYLASAGVGEFDLNYGKDHVETNHSMFQNRAQPNMHRVSFNLDDKFQTGNDIYFYYRLDNYFQNLRTYMKSRDDEQLLGKVVILDKKETACKKPYLKASLKGKKAFIAPCGAIANSMFNDTFELYYFGEKVPFTYKGVAWEVDKTVKFKNPTGKLWEELKQKTAKPTNWLKHVTELDLEDPDNNGYQNVDFIVWMRTAALPNFRKLYRILDRSKSPTFARGLPPGRYDLVIFDNYPVSRFHAKKHFIISSTSWVGGKNSFLGIIYMVVGSLCIVVGCIFLVIHLNFGNS